MPEQPINLASPDYWLMAMMVAVEKGRRKA
jgi:hypothetical protein